MPYSERKKRQRRNTKVILRPRVFSHLGAGLSFIITKGHEVMRGFRCSFHIYYMFKMS